MIIVKRRTKQLENPDDTAINIVDRIYHNRGLDPQNLLEKSLAKLIPVTELKNADKAAQLLANALEQDQHIVVIGDFDSDGATSTAVAISALRAFGGKRISYLVPNRFDFGYGLSPEIVDVAQQQNPDLIVTVDNGIANHQGVARARELGIAVLITDHHLPSDTLPDANVIVNPNQPEDTFPSKNLAGVGVIFYVMLALRSVLRERNWFVTQNIIEPNMASLLDLVALGTVADVVPLDANNRILVHQGLSRIRAGQVRPGIQALLTIANRNIQRIVASDFGFAVAPRLNAAGRLDDMTIGIQCLLAEDLTTALQIAGQLDNLNQERRLIESQMQQQAFSILDQINLSNHHHAPMGVCLYQPDWHQGVIGVLASRVKDKLHKPVIIFAKGNETELKGSARSVAGVHIRDVLADIAMQHPQLIIKFGGHAMAAGLTILAENFAEFSHVFANEVAKYLSSDDLTHTILTDGELTQDSFSIQLAEQLRFLEPWGQHFPEPVFDGIFQVYDQRLVGQKHLKLLLGVPGSDKLIDAIAFNIDINQWPNHHCQMIFAAYRLDVNEYRGRQDLQIVIEYLEVKD